jgi:DNA-binding CsgD family transcriptional regulator
MKKVTLPYQYDFTPLAQKRKSRKTLMEERENERVQMMADGLTNKEIGEKLFLAERTVENYTLALCKRYKAVNKTNLVLIFMRLGRIK